MTAPVDTKVALGVRIAHSPSSSSITPSARVSRQYGSSRRRAADTTIWKPPDTTSHTPANSTRTCPVRPGQANSTSPARAPVTPASTCSPEPLAAYAGLSASAAPRTMNNKPVTTPREPTLHPAAKTASPNATDTRPASKGIHQRSLTCAARSPNSPNSDCVVWAALALWFIGSPLGRQGTLRRLRHTPALPKSPGPPGDGAFARHLPCGRGLPCHAKRPAPPLRYCRLDALTAARMRASSARSWSQGNLAWPGLPLGRCARSRMTVTPQSRSVEMLRPNAGWRARATFGQGTVTIGRPRPIASFSSPSASVSLIPAAHLLMVLKVAGTAAKASAGGKTSGASGSLKLVRTGWPVSAVSWAISRNLAPSGVVITQVSQPAVRAGISAGSSRAGAAPDATTYSTGRRSTAPPQLYLPATIRRATL